MIYKIFLPCCYLVVSFLQAICSSQRLKQKTKQKQNKQTKKTRLKVIEVVYNNLNSNQFALPKLELYKSLKGFICWRKGLVSKKHTYFDRF
jgi:hypothetical protein